MATQVTLPKLAQSSSTAALASTAAPSVEKGMAKSASQPTVSKPSNAASLPDPMVPIKFNPGYHGLSCEGTAVTSAALQAWMKGVRPGWTVKVVAGKVLQDDDEAADILQDVALAGSKYEVLFHKGAPRYGVQAERPDVEQENNRQRLLKAFPYQGGIERADHRSITCTHLERVLIFAEEGCGKWRDTAPAARSRFAGQKLKMHFLNHQHINDWIILPATQKRQCAFAELLIAQKQLPVWFVNHWWGEPFVDFVGSLHAHASVRGLDPDMGNYWIWAYCARQHLHQSDIDDNTKGDSIRALRATRFSVLLVVDAQLTVFSRLWCAFDTARCLDQPKFTLDVALHGGEAGPRVLTQGLTPEELAMEMEVPGKGAQAKVMREAQFPVEALEAGLQIDVETCAATETSDATHILNRIADRPLESVPVKEHSKYAETNRRLRAAFARVLLVRATAAKAHPVADTVSHALREDLLLKASDMHLEGLNSDGMKLLAQSWPPSLQDLKLRLQCATITDEDLMALSERLPKKLRSIGLDLAHCRGLSDEGIAAFANLLREHAHISVDVELSQSEAIQRVEAYERPRKYMSSAFGVSLCNERKQLQRFRYRVLPAVPELVRTLQRDDRTATRNAAARALGSLGESARDAEEALERAIAEDQDESVQATAKAALLKVRGGS
mmetsp:Transcript_33412/g.92304  ORF Transcript_33412/g.92304 Transcript_33412/m.92304 type:complete len:671 (-) Transcript_33412:117-2129(-)|eukprot:CAMPEP_0117507234 /NCGR_PEP_ID=MMETSP0784-20121206/26320_1 /TAXON_ID=39447 /ORGANISM="" /LENGTH=670 /DNA_ID=CAMNT_0005302735 /DNA_START=81 /DNA_END=2093 /DNA_ORIENTATION=-